MKAKRILCAALAAVFCLPLGACGDDDGQTVHVYMPDGAPAVALSKLMHDGYDGADFTVVPADTIAPQVSSGTADMAIMPVNAAATLYNAGKDIVMLSVNTHGNLYILGKSDIASLDDLVGKRLASIGKGGVPENTLRLLLDNSGIDYEQSETAVDGKVAIRFAEASAMAPLIKQNKADCLLLAEPAVTTIMNALAADDDPSNDVQVAIDVQTAWKNVFTYDYPQACLVAKGSLIDDNKEFVEKFLAALGNSDGWAAQHPTEALEAIKTHMISGTETTLKALSEPIVSRCNIRTVAAEDARENCTAYFNLLTGLMTDLGQPALAKAPNNEFYYM